MDALFKNRSPRQLVFFASILFLFALSVYNPPVPYRVFSRFCPFHWGVTFAGFSIPVILFLILQYLIIALFGFALISPFFLSLADIPVFIKLTASFFMGYLSAVGIVRPLSFVLPYHHVYLPAMAIIIPLTFHFLKKHHPDYRQKIRAAFRLQPRDGVILLLMLIFIAAALLIQIQQADFRWVGHGVQQYAYNLDNWRAAKLPHFPFIPRHYDELLFHYFLTLPLPARFSPILPWWITLALVKISAVTFLFLIFKKWGISNRLSSLFSFFMILGTSSLIPFHYYMLFDDLNPIFYTAHTERIVGILACLFLVTQVLFPESAKPHLPILFFVLFGFGLAATTISNPLWVLPFYGLACFFRCVTEQNAVKNTAENEKSGPQVAWGFTYLAFATPLALYALPFDKTIFYVMRMGLIACIIGYLSEEILSKIKRLNHSLTDWMGLEGNRRMILVLVVWSLATLLSLLFLGNMLAMNPLTLALIKKGGGLVG